MLPARNIRRYILSEPLRIAAAARGCCSPLRVCAVLGRYHNSYTAIKAVALGHGFGGKPVVNVKNTAPII
jgi:hypothetical protein